LELVAWLVELVVFARLKPIPSSPKTLNLSLNPYCAPNDPATPMVPIVDFTVDVVIPELVLSLVLRA
jgi:hypothetical protein